MEPFDVRVVTRKAGPDLPARWVMASVDSTDARCRYCPATIWWGMNLLTGKKLPIDPPDPGPGGRPHQVHAVSHWLTCSGARQAAADRDARRAPRAR